MTAAPSRPRRFGALVEIVVTVALAIVLYLVIQTFVAQTYRVEMESMEPTLLPGQYLLIDKLTPRVDDYSRGDIVVFHPPDGSPDAIPLIKRVIGVGGDHLAIRGGAVYVNGVRLDEPYLNSDGLTEPLTKQSSWDVPKGSLFVMGDHRSVSQDSRLFGFVQVDQVIGRAWLRLWPLDGLGVLQTPTYPNVPAAPSPSP